jgi:hypothetical protein
LAVIKTQFKADFSQLFNYLAGGMSQLLSIKSSEKYLKLIKLFGLAPFSVMNLRSDLININRQPGAVEDQEICDCRHWQLCDLHLLVAGRCHIDGDVKFTATSHLENCYYIAEC